MPEEFARRIHPAHPSQFDFQGDRSTARTIPFRERTLNAMPRVQPAQRRIGKIPFSGVETKSLIDHDRLILRTPRLAKKYRLPSVGVASPFVENQHAEKIFEIFHLAELQIGKVIKRRNRCWIPRISRTELQPGLARHARKSDLHIHFFSQRISSSPTSTTAHGDVGNPSLPARNVPSISFTRTLVCCGLFLNFTT